MGEVERIARLMVKALYLDVDPDDRVCPMPPRHIGSGTAAGFFIMPRQELTLPIWRLMEPAARVIVDDIERKMESSQR